MKHRGSISCKHPSFAALNLFSFYSPHLECPTVCKVGEAQGISGGSRREEPEGEVVATPSGETTTHDSGTMPSLPPFFY